MTSPPAAGARPAASAACAGDAVLAGCPPARLGISRLRRPARGGPVLAAGADGTAVRRRVAPVRCPGLARRANIVLDEHYNALRAGLGGEMACLAQLPAGGPLAAGCAQTINCYTDRDIEAAHLPVPAGPAGRACHDPARHAPACERAGSAVAEGIWLSLAGSSAPQPAMRRPW
jgi:hypothetical protein